MPNKSELRKVVKNTLDDAVQLLNSALNGDGLEYLETTLTRLGRGGELPHWFSQLQADQVLPNMDGKTVGSVIEMLFLAVLENHIFNDAKIQPFSVNPARGVDYPDLNLGIKSPSTNYCTSEPFFLLTKDYLEVSTTA